MIFELEPKLVFKYFDEILKIPRPSKKEEKIISYLEDFAKEQKLEIQKDKAGNIVIRKAACKGYENRKSVVLQSHVDMVCEKNADVKHDFMKDPVPAYIDGDWIKAKGTTLGADNGIGVATQLALLADKSIEHGPIECLFTIDEETGLTGAFMLKENMIKSKILINLDSEDEGEIFIGCAGGVDTLIDLPLKYKKTANNQVAFNIKLSGLKGGHSGDDINKGYANSNLLLFRLLLNLSKKYAIGLSDFQGGNLRNAIPREAEATIVVKNKLVEKLKSTVKEYEQVIKSEFATTEPELKLKVTETKLPKEILKNSVFKKLIYSVYSCPNGVISMSQDVEGLVETSTNLASIKIIMKTAHIVTSQRSSVETAKTDIADRIKCNFNLAGAKVKHTESYPGWTPNTNSEILGIATNAYKKLFGKDAKVKAIHAGLECGLFLEKYPYLDMISIGPTMRGVHSPDERLQVSTVDMYWKFLLQILKDVPDEK
ncbi:MAG: aminoacyl-histidine dipeptidase [Bacteroidales bacterium]|nr:aminoacyl-histidine dipeptidase [Bacteroidales bacterium]MBN2820215.1 aminoacyl-histidine dipeptidase [Bacteroidales bacterium]